MARTLEPSASADEHRGVLVPRRPEQTLLHRIVREQLETFLARATAGGATFPRFPEQELRAYLRCGILAHGFLRLHCDACGQDRLVPFSCKRRGFCPSCGGRRMSDVAAHLVDSVLPEVPARQWVLTLPYPLRDRCAYDAGLTTEVLRAFTRAVFAELRRRARRRWELRDGACGAVTFIQRFGSALNLNLHFHTLVLDGVYISEDRRSPRFLPLPSPSREEVARVLAGTARRIARVLRSRADGDEDALARDVPLLATLAAASLRRRIATGPHTGERWRRLGDRVEPGNEDGEADPEATPRVPQYGGMSLHAEVAVPARDRERLERLCRYVARPPLASERLEEGPDGQLTLRLKTRWRDGTTHILMDRSELIEKLVPLIPPPRAHQVRYHGILAPAARTRARVVPDSGAPGPSIVESPEAAVRPTGDARAPAAAGSRGRARGLERTGESKERRDRESGAHPAQPASGDDTNDRDASPRGRRRRTPWAELLQRVFGVDALRCPGCGSRMRLLAAIEEPSVIRRILACLDLPARAPPIWSAAVAPDELAPDHDDLWGVDQTARHEDP